MHEGTRTAIVRPAGQSPHPVVIVLHGRGITADLTLRTSGFAEAAARHSFTAVFPQGSLLQWHDGRAGGPPGPDDVAFLRALTARLIEDRIALPGHIYIAGISNGGMMSFTMACQAGELFRGMGTVIANMPAGVEPCNLPPMPLVMVNGTADPLMPYRGGGVGVLGLQGKVLSAEKTAELFAHRNGCGASTAQALAEKSPGGGPTVTEIAWNGCSSGKSVTLYRIEGGGHQIPGQPAFLRFLLGQSNTAFSAAEAILSAFDREEANGA
jgi:polyhydroxybutyrate depolymerase